jgi:hypothetical protein
MPYTVPAAFDKFVAKISLSEDNTETATARRDRIVSLLQNDFTILEAFATGSVPRGTGIRGYTDLDVIVALHYTKHIKDKKPSQVLQAVRTSLAAYRTDLRRNGQAVTLTYDTWPNVDIVPVSRYADDAGTITHFNVPDMTREIWMPSRPKTHSNNIASSSRSFGSHFKSGIRMVKWWNKQHSDLLTSFHIEVMALKTDFGLMGDYPWDVFKFFDSAAKLVAGPLWYEGGFVDDYLDWKTRPEAVKRLETARDKARDAWSLTYNGRSDHAGAMAIWRQIFSDTFPAYGS